MLRLLAVWFALGVLLVPSAVSDTRKITEWSQSDPDRLLTDSPWSIPAAASMDDPSDQRDQTPSAPPAASAAGMPGNSNPGGGANGARWDGGIGRNRMGRLPTIPLQIRWESAAIVQAALAKLHKPLTEGLAAASAKDYVLSVTGLIPAHRYRSQALMGSKKSSSSETSDPSDPEEVLESFMANSRLSWKGVSVQPDNVRLDADTGTVHIFFPRAELSKKDRELLFTTSFGSMHAFAKFHPKDMSIDGKPDL